MTDILKVIHYCLQKCLEILEISVMKYMNLIKIKLELLTDTDNPSVQVYVNEIQNRVAFKIKNGYSLELLTLEK